MNSAVRQEQSEWLKVQGRTQPSKGPWYSPRWLRLGASPGSITLEFVYPDRERSTADSTDALEGHGVRLDISRASGRVVRIVAEVSTRDQASALEAAEACLLENQHESLAEMLRRDHRDLEKIFRKLG